MYKHTVPVSKLYLDVLFNLVFLDTTLSKVSGKMFVIRVSLKFKVDKAETELLNHK